MYLLTSLFDYVNLFLTDEYLDRQVQIYKAFLDSNEAIVSDPLLIFSGRINNPVIKEDVEAGTSTVAVQASSLFVDFDKINARFTNNESQQSFFDGDTGFRFSSVIVKELTDQEIIEISIIENVQRSQLKPLEESAYGVGVTASSPSVDGVVRAVPMVVSANDQLYPSIALETLRAFQGFQGYQMKVSDAGIEWVRIGKLPPLDTMSNGDINVSYWNKFESISAADLPLENPIGKTLELSLIHI